MLKAALRGAAAGRAVSRRHEHLVGRIDGESVACEERDRDRYGRVVAVCRHRAQDVNAWLVREGWALAYRRYSTAYVGEQADAKAAKRGVWRGEFVPPWDWRRGDRLKSASPRRPRESHPGCSTRFYTVIGVVATSRGTSATTPGSASTTCPAIVTTSARESAPRAVSGTSAAKPKRGRLDGVEPGGKPVNFDRATAIPSTPPCTQPVDCSGEFQAAFGRTSTLLGGALVRRDRVSNPDGIFAPINRLASAAADDGH